MIGSFVPHSDYLALYRVTGKDEYFRRAIQLGARFKHTLRLDGECYR